jgi:hypothetical protein
MATPPRLTRRKENAVLLHIYQAVRQCAPDRFDSHVRWRPAEMLDLQEPLRQIIRNAWAIPGHRLANRADLCSECFYQTPVGVCPHRQSCAVHQHADLIISSMHEAMAD